MILQTFLFFLFFALALFVLGFKYIGELKYGSQIFHFASAFLILMCGLIVLVDGLDFRSGASITEVNSTSTVISYEYNKLDGSFNGSYGLSALLLILSLLLFFYTITEIKYIKNKPSEYSEEED